MRPDILNPLFTEVKALKGVGPQIARLLEKLDIERAVDLLYHLPTGAIERIKASGASASLLGRNVILELTPFDNRESQVRARTDAHFHKRFRGQHDQPRLFQQSRLGEALASQGREADRLGKARAIWRRMADHSSRSDAAGERAIAPTPRAYLSADGGADEPSHGRARARGSGARARASRMD